MVLPLPTARTPTQLYPSEVLEGTKIPCQARRAGRARQSRNELAFRYHAGRHQPYGGECVGHALGARRLPLLWRGGRRRGRDQRWFVD